MLRIYLLLMFLCRISLTILSIYIIKVVCLFEALLECIYSRNQISLMVIHLYLTLWAFTFSYYKFFLLILFYNISVFISKTAVSLKFDKRLKCDAEKMVNSMFQPSRMKKLLTQKLQQKLKLVKLFLLSQLLFIQNEREKKDDHFRFSHHFEQ